MPNAYVWLPGGREGGQKCPKDAYVIHGCSLSPILFFMTAKFLVFADYLVDFSLSIFRVLDQVIENTNQCQFRNVLQSNLVILNG